MQSIVIAVQQWNLISLVDIFKLIVVGKENGFHVISSQCSVFAFSLKEIASFMQCEK